MSASRAPRGVRLNNPGNIDRTRPRTAWQGRVPDDQLVDPRFEQFIHAKWGIRALARTLITYQDAHGLRTVRSILNRWAPPNGRNPATGEAYTQNTSAYVDHVCALTGFGADERLDVQQYETARKLVNAIIRHEQGMQPYGAATIDEGLRLAGIVPAQAKPAMRDPVNVGGAVALAGAGAEVVSRAVETPEVTTAAAQSEVLTEALPLVSMIGGWALTLTVLAALGLLAYRWWQRRQGVE